MAAVSDVVLVMFDPCCDPFTPGWPLRNVLLLAAVRWGVRQLKVVCVRDSSAGKADAERCFVLEVRIWLLSATVSLYAAQLLEHSGYNAQGPNVT